MSKRIELRCPLCGAPLLKVRLCKDAELPCHACGASLLITKNEDESCFVSARPQGYSTAQAN